MQNVLVSRHVSRSASSCGRLAPTPAAQGSSASPKPEGGEADQQFMAMLDAYRPSGGLASGTEVFALFARRCGADVGTLAGWIVNRKVICFAWQSTMWLPLFQFNRLDMTPQPGLREVLQAFPDEQSPWRLAQWFARPHRGLANQSPCDTLAGDPLAVQRAAGSERRTFAH